MRERKGREGRGKNREKRIHMRERVTETWRETESQMQRE